MKRLLVYGGAAGLLIAALRFVDYRFLVIEHSVAIYGAIIATVFAVVGIRLGLTLTREKIIVKEVTVPAGPFVFNQDEAQRRSITPREIEVLQLMADGLSNKEMAERLFVSENTVKTHCSRVFEKLGASRRTQAVQVGRQMRLIP